MSDTQTDANAARIAELRTQRGANLIKARAARAANREDAPTPKAVEKAPEPTVLGKIAMNAEAARAAKIEALRRAKATRDPNAAPERIVTCRVTKAGDGKISMGEHVAGLGDLTYDRNEIIDLPETTALQHEANHYVEIED